MKTITVTVDPKGNIKVETTGFTGGACRDASRFLEQALGHATGEALTAAFYQQSTAQPQDLKQSS